jgi:hypothetical protein
LTERSSFLQRSFVEIAVDILSVRAVLGKKKAGGRPLRNLMKIADLVLYKAPPQKRPSRDRPGTACDF